MSTTNGFSLKTQAKKKIAEFNIKTKIYPPEAIYQAAYFFIDKAYIFLDGNPSQEIKVALKMKQGQNESLEKIVGEFHNELLNQLLRQKISQANARIREYIVAQALYNAVPSEVDKLLTEAEEEDWQKDALGINKSWEKGK